MNNFKIISPLNLYWETAAAVLFQLNKNQQKAAIQDFFNFASIVVFKGFSIRLQHPNPSTAITIQSQSPLNSNKKYNVVLYWIDKIKLKLP